MDALKERWGHHSALVYGAILVAVYGAAVGLYPFPLWLYLLLTLIAVLTYLSNSFHNGIMCDRCLDLMPEDKNKAAEKHDFLFKFVHFFGTIPRAAMYLAVVFLASLGLIYAMGTIFWYPTLIVWALFFVLEFLSHDYLPEVKSVDRLSLTTLRTRI